ncbi:MAG: hypothetical protein V3V01_19370 [Acidimicrobiales bacterium]
MASDTTAQLIFDHLEASGLHESHELLEIGYDSGARHSRPLAELHSGSYRFQQTDEFASTPAGPSGNRFDVSGFNTSFDVAVAQSVFAFLPFNDVRLCLYQTAKVLGRNGCYYSTFFNSELAPPPADFANCYFSVNPLAPGPFSYSIDDLQRAAAGLGWSVREVTDWLSPDGQQLACFRRRSTIWAPRQAFGRRRRH